MTDEEYDRIDAIIRESDNVQWNLHALLDDALTRLKHICCERDSILNEDLNEMLRRGIVPGAKFRIDDEPQVYTFLGITISGDLRFERDGKPVPGTARSVIKYFDRIHLVEER